MNNPTGKSIFLVLLALFLLVTIIGFSLTLPPHTQAHPQFGYTPEPPPGGGGGGGGGGGDDDDSSLPPDPGTPATNYVLVQIDQCDVEGCPIEVELAGMEQFDNLLASTASDPLFLPLLPERPNALPAEMLVQVRLVHEGSGWIAENTLSTRNGTHISVPYPGRWEVSMISQPRFMTDQAINATGTNLAQLQTQLANGPVLLGMVEANTSETQMVRCPLECVIEPPSEAPPFLPETGTPSTANLSILLVIGVIFTGGGLLLFWRTTAVPEK